MPTQCEIQTCINNLNSSSDVTEMIILAAETNEITPNRSIPVANVNSLPDLLLGTISVGTVFFVQSLCVPVVAGVGCWVGMDNRVLRQDYPAADAYAWGAGSRGQLGDNTCVAKSSPVSVVGGFTDWCHISSGGYQKVAVRSNGTAWAWGRNNSAQLGDGTTVSKSSPVSVVGGFTNWNIVHTGSTHTVGLRQDGTLWAWGYNGQGQIGANNTTARSSPVSVVGGFTDWCQLWAGNKNSFGIKTNGVLYAWGYNNSGRLGTNSTATTSSPVSVVGGFTDWCQVSGCNHTLAVRTNGTAWAWGCGYSGQLGNGQFGSYGSPNARSSPVSVVGGITDWCQVAGGFRHSLGVRTNGTLYSWGWQQAGQLGTNNNDTCVNSPVAVVGGFTDWCQVAAGYNNSSALRTNGTAWAWGYNNSGALGDNSTASKSSPVSVAGGFTNWCQVSQANTHGAGIRLSAV